MSSSPGSCLQPGARVRLVSAEPTAAAAAAADGGAGLVQPPHTLDHPFPAQWNDRAGTLGDPTGTSWTVFLDEQVWKVGGTAVTVGRGKRGGKKLTAVPSDRLALLAPLEAAARSALGADSVEAALALTRFAPLDVSNVDMPGC